MAYPPPPGTNNLPARPPASKSGFKPAFFAAPRQATSSYANSTSSAPSAPSYPGAPSYGAAASTTQYGAYPGAVSAPGAASSTTTASASYGSYPQQQSQSYGAQSYGAPPTYAGPQIRNPFPTPGAPGSDYDPEMAAQIAQWQSAYVSRDSKDAAAAAGPRATDSPKPEMPAVAAPNADRKKTVAREGGGKKWTDDTLLEWDPSHLRLFVGNLAGETTDESLLKAFARWRSVQKARVIRDKRTAKSKGFGFVSFSDADDFFQAAKEMNGKYIQSHPVVVRKANTEIKVTNVKDKDRGKKNNKNKNKHGSGNGGGGGNGHDGGYQPNLGPIGGGGITKPGQKTKNGLRLLG